MASSSEDNTSVADVVAFVRTYATQETVGPLKGAGRWLLWSVIGSVLLGVGFVFVMLGLLRMLQTEWFDGRTWSFVPYLVAGVLSLVVVGLARNQIDKKYLYKEQQ